MLRLGGNSRRVALLICGLQVTLASASIYWNCETTDAAPCAVRTVKNRADAGGLDATCSAGTTTLTSDVFPAPTRQIAQGSSGVVVNPDNRTSLYFDGKSRLTAPGTFKPEAFTVEAFIKVGAHHDYPLLIGKVRDRARNSATWSLSVSGRKIRARFDTYPESGTWPAAKGFNQSFSSGVDVEDGRWHHVAFTYERQTVRIYVDYLLCGTHQTDFPLVYTDGELCVGDGAGEGPFTGWIDEIRITPQVLDPSEFLTALAFSAQVRDEWMLQRGTNTSAVGAAWNEWVRTDRLLRRQAAEGQTGVVERRAQLAQLKQRLEALSERSAASLYMDIRALKRACMLGDAQVNFSSILAIDNPYVAGSEAYHEVRHRTENCAGHGGRLLVIDGLTPDAPVRALAPHNGVESAFWRPDLSFDAARVLFCMKQTNAPAYHLYETGIDGTGTRQITQSDYNDLDPIYTPDGAIVFSTSRCNQFLRCGDSKFRMFILARCDREGKNIYFISANNEADFTPTLLPDGRVLFTRWEYVDREVNRIQSPLDRQSGWHRGDRLLG